MKIVTIGGGGGHAQVLKGIKNLVNVDITAICPSTDSGGSTGLLQRDYGVPGYLGDMTKCISALCPDDEMAKALLYRFDGGCLDGHSVKNVLFLGLEKVCGLKKALGLMYEMCGLGPNRRVIPVTDKPAKLCARLQIGNEIQGETHIDNIAQNPLWHPDYHAIQSIYLKPDVPASDEAVNAIMNSDWLVVSPGDLYSSILPVLLPDGIGEAIAFRRPKVVIILNIMTKKGETDRYSVMDFVARIEKYLGLPAHTILCNSAELEGELLIKYALEQKVQLVIPGDVHDPRLRISPLASITEEGFVYHDPRKIFSELFHIFQAG